MKSPKLTEWFGSDVKPRIAGVYQRDYGRREGGLGIQFAYWDGKRWGIYGWDKQNAKDMAGLESSYKLKWRGLASDPSKESSK